MVLREDFSEPSQKSLPLGWSYKALTIGRCSHDVRRHVKNVVFSSLPILISSPQLNKSNWSIKPKRHRHFNYGDKWAITLLCRLRVGRSFLKSHGFQINLSNTDCCLCGEEDHTQSFFLSCFLFQQERKEMLEKVQTIFLIFLNKVNKGQHGTDPLPPHPHYGPYISLTLCLNRKLTFIR